MYVISYDISVDKRRNKIFKLLKSYGRPRQYSLFECDISAKRYKELYSQLVALMDGEEQGSIRIYNLCKSCSADIRVIGIKEEGQADGAGDILFI